MAVTTSQQISKYYEVFKNIDVTFNKEVIRTIGLNTKQVFMKCLGEQWPCIIYSSSMVGVKVIVNMTADLFEKIKKANNSISVRFSFKSGPKENSITFFVSGKVLGFSKYNTDGGGNLNFVNMEFTQRPPDDLIEIFGKLLEANVNSHKRKEERIVITTDTLRTLNVRSQEAILTVDKIPRKCIIRDLSFSGSKVMLVGVGKMLANKQVILSIETDDHRKIHVPGTIVRFEQMEGRKEIAILALVFNPQNVPMAYKMIINDYLTQFRKPGGARNDKK